MTAESIAKAGGGRMAGSCWVAPRPTQDERGLSLSISDGDDGKVLARCHAGCEWERVIAALRSRDLWTGYDTAPDGELCGLTCTTGSVQVRRQSRNDRRRPRAASRIASLPCGVHRG
jgi:hypothetical protein